MQIEMWIPKVEGFSMHSLRLEPRKPWRILILIVIYSQLRSANFLVLYSEPYLFFQTWWSLRKERYNLVEENRQVWNFDDKTKIPRRYELERISTQSSRILWLHFPNEKHPLYGINFIRRLQNQLSISNTWTQQMHKLHVESKYWGIPETQK